MTLRQLFAVLAADLVYCATCGWWYPPHNH